MSPAGAPAARRGSALTEFVVLMIAMVPLMFGIPMIGKLIDLKQTTVRASRYAAWETTVNEPGAPPSDVRGRFFDDPSAPLASEGAGGGNVLWGSAVADAPSGPVADTRVAIDEGTVAAALGDAYGGDGATSGPARVLGEVIERTGKVFATVTDGDWEVEGDGLVRADVSVDVEANGWLQRETMTQSSVIMNGTWSAADDAQAKERTRTFVPAGLLDNENAPFGQALAEVGRLPLFKEFEGLAMDGPDGTESAFGYIDVEPLPPSEEAERVLTPAGRIR